MFANNASLQNVQSNAALICKNLRDSFTAVGNFYAWLSAQADTDLENLGFVPQDITFLRSAFDDLSDLRNIYNNQASSITLPYDFTVNSKQVIGPN